MMTIGPADPMMARPAMPPRGAASRGLDRLCHIGLRRGHGQRHRLGPPRGSADKPESGGKGNRDDDVTHDVSFLLAGQNRFLDKGSWMPASIAVARRKIKTGSPGHHLPDHAARLSDPGDPSRRHAGRAVQAKAYRAARQAAEPDNIAERIAAKRGQRDCPQRRRGTGVAQRRKSLPMSTAKLAAVAATDKTISPVGRTRDHRESASCHFAKVMAAGWGS